MPRFRLTLGLILIVTSLPASAQTVTKEQLAEFSALVVAEQEAGLNLCSQYFFVNPRVVEEVQTAQYPALQAVDTATSQALLRKHIKGVLAQVSQQGDRAWCQSWRERMRGLGGLGVALFEE